ncbi:hypothetical protein ACLQ2R_32520 [Streptosporangium sp. DT93]|uniref:hypothetical protein n=1 Tax=Streptosporangium sp. DT93 TaxID=3393428 RepID=UPI003CEE42FB
MHSISPLPVAPLAQQGATDLAVNPVLAIAVILTILYLISCKFHPYMRCKACNKSKESNSTTFKGAFGKCRTCNGKGHSVRLGARFLGHKD